MVNSFSENSAVAILLAQGLNNLNLPTEKINVEIIQSKLLQYIYLIQKWNQVYNLTAIRSPAEMVTKHILDSLSITPYITGQRIIDVGTGAGLPGIPLAIIFPEKQFTLLDSNEKKTRFLQQCVGELVLKNVTIIHSRVENYAANPCFDQVLTRAFASLKAIWQGTHHLCCSQGSVLAMKGIHVPEEIAEIKNTVHADVIDLQVPGLQAARHVVILSALLA